MLSLFASYSRIEVLSIRYDYLRFLASRRDAIATRSWSNLIRMKVVWETDMRQLEHRRRRFLIVMHLL